ncbi:DUF4912 domain-containing protein [bacterium]|nr:DUF4912 domain-containing protein [bacterium]
MEKKKPAKKVVKKAAVTKRPVKKTVAKKTAKTGKQVKSPAKKAVAKKSVKKAVVKKQKTVSRISAKAGKPVSKEVAEKKDQAMSSSAMPVFQDSGGNENDFWQDSYEDNRIVLMIRDPYWCFVYWDLSMDRQTEVIREIQNASAKIVLRIYDVTDIEFDGSNAHRTQDIEVTEEATNWYINVWDADRAYCVDLGLLYSDGHFVTLARSNVVTTPRDSVSPVVDEEWMVVDETFDRLYKSAGASAPGQTSEGITKYMLKRVRADVTSGGLASMGSEGGRPQPVKTGDFWLVVNTEVIVYGATEADANVTIQGQPVKLNQDGTFSVRYALPDGKQRIIVEAESSEGTQQRKITPVIGKHTE